MGTRNLRLLVMVAAMLANRFAIGQVAAGESPTTDRATPATQLWQYGGFIDAGYLYDFNHPANHLFRSRGTTFHIDEPDLNMAVLYVRKGATESSRWGTEVTFQTGKDSEVFGFSAT